MLFSSFPREVGLPRRIVNDIEEYLKFINTYNGKKKHIFQSVYSCNIVVNKPDYNNVTIDKLFFDFDTEDAWEECNKLHLYLKKEKIRHIINFSGRGYHIYIVTKSYIPKHAKSCLYNAQKFFMDKLRLECDTQIFGDVSRLCRVPNTYNIKRKRFCIPLKENDFERGGNFCKNLALRQNRVKHTGYMGGDILLDLQRFDNKTKEEDSITIENLDKSSSSNGLLNLEHLPTCIQKLLKKKNLGFKGRYLVILYFREKGYTKKEVLEILKNHLSEKKLNHCIVEEKQLQYLFERNDLMFPSCEKIIQDGFCREKCEFFGKVVYK